MADPRGDILKYTGVNYAFAPTYYRDRAPTISDVADEQGLYKVPSIWVHIKSTTAPVDADVWILVNLQANNANGATWLLFTGGTGGSITELRANDGNVAAPLAGIIDVDGNIVANGTNALPLFTRANIANTLDIDLQIATTVTPTPADSNDAGISSFNENHFTIDATSGMVSLAGGGIAADQFAVDAATAPGTDPVLPSATGEVGIFGNLVVAHSVPIETHSRAANDFNIEPQISTAVSAPDVNDNGMSHFDSAAFTVDADGFVELVGGGTAAISFETDDGAPNVVPDAAGEIQVLGGSNVSVTGQGPGNTITIDATGFASFTCLEVTTDVDPMLPFIGYVANAVGLITFTLPVTAAFGEQFVVIRKGAGNVSIAQNAGQTIHYNGVDTSTGVAGSLDSNAQWDTIWIKTVTADTDFVVLNSSGTWTAN